MLRGFDGLEPDEGDLHGAEEADDEEGVVGDIDPLRESSHEEEHKHVEGDQIDDEDVASPCGHHVEVGHGRQGAPVHGPSLDSLDPEVVGEHESKDGNTLIVITACH